MKSVRSILPSIAVALSMFVSPVLAEEAVRVVVLPYLSQAPIFIAIEEGFFEKEGVQIERIDLRSPRPVLAGLMTGEFDVALNLPNAGLFNAITRGGSARIVGPGVVISSEQCDYIVLYGQDGFDRSSLAPGKPLTVKIGTNALGYFGFVADKIKEFSGSEGLSFEYLDMPIFTVGDALTARNIDMAPAAEPWISRFQDAGIGQITIGLKEILPDSQFTVLIFSRRLVSEDMDLGARVKRALYAAILQYTEGNTDRNVEIIAKYTGLSEELLRRACWAYYPTDNIVRTDSLMSYQAWLLEKKAIDEIVPIDAFISKIVTE